MYTSTLHLPMLLLSSVCQVVDMIAATLSVTLRRTLKVDFTIPYYDYAGIQILMKKPVQDKNLFNFLTVFRYLYLYLLLIIGRLRACIRSRPLH